MLDLFWRTVACGLPSASERAESAILCRKRWTAKVHRSRTQQTGVAAGCANDSDRSASPRCRIRRHARRLRAAVPLRRREPPAHVALEPAAAPAPPRDLASLAQHSQPTSLHANSDRDLLIAPLFRNPVCSRRVRTTTPGCERAPKPQRAAPQCVRVSHTLVSRIPGAAPAAGGCGWVPHKPTRRQKM